MGRQKFRQKFLPEGPPPICCQLVISLKSNSWQHIGASESILTFCRKNAHFETFQHSQENLHFSYFEILKHMEGPLSTTNQHIDSLGAILLRNNMCCFCCWKLLILLIFEKWKQKKIKNNIKYSIKSTIFSNKNNTYCF